MAKMIKRLMLGAALLQVAGIQVADATMIHRPAVMVTVPRPMGSDTPLTIKDMDSCCSPQGLMAACMKDGHTYGCNITTGACQKVS